MTRGLVEAARLGRRLGADPEPFAGLAGVGDLIPRPVESTRRHICSEKLWQGERISMRPNVACWKFRERGELGGHCQR
ncbi:MAG: hypothetical protein R3C68_16555 [Myxococcota bacterium]